MMLILSFLLLMAGTSVTGAPQDLSGKMFTFPEETASAHVKITTSNHVLGAFSVCLRFFTDLPRSYSVFSLSSPTKAVSFMIINVGKYFEVYVNDVAVYMHSFEVKPNTWHSVCSTWSSGTGLTQLWLNGKPSNRRFTSNANLLGAFTITLGQSQSNQGFLQGLSLVGMISDLHIWDYVLSPGQISSHNRGTVTPAGNILNWTSIEYETSGRVYTEEQIKESLQ